MDASLTQNDINTSLSLYLLLIHLLNDEEIKICGHESKHKQDLQLLPLTHLKHKHRTRYLRSSSPEKKKTISPTIIPKSRPTRVSTHPVHPGFDLFKCGLLFWVLCLYYFTINPSFGNYLMRSLLTLTNVRYWGKPMIAAAKWKKRRQ
jgi:hypothetical protein